MRFGVLLAQLGTPDEPTVPAVRRYLRAFLSDHRVVDLPRIVWLPILHGLILRTRPKRSAALYGRIWTERGSPLLFHTEDLASKLGAEVGPDITVACGMRIGSPSMASRLDALVDAGAERLLVLPCFPQFSTATTLSIQDAVDAWIAEHPDGPAVTVLPSFPDEPAYIEALAASVRTAGVDPTPERPLVMSFHGLPKRFVERGDPYPEECERTAAALATALDLPDDTWHLVYQSRFGRAAWLEPYATQAVADLASGGIKHISVISPSFLADCLETIDELGRELRETFVEAGGESFTRVPCLNSDDSLVAALASIVRASA